MIDHNTSMFKINNFSIVPSIQSGIHALNLTLSDNKVNIEGDSFKILRDHFKQAQETIEMNNKIRKQPRENYKYEYMLMNDWINWNAAKMNLFIYIVFFSRLLEDTMIEICKVNSDNHKSVKLFYMILINLNLVEK